MTGEVEAYASRDQHDPRRLQLQPEGPGPAAPLEGHLGSAEDDARDQESDHNHSYGRDRDQDLMLGLMDQSKDRAPEGCAQTDEGGQVDRRRRKQTRVKRRA